MYIYMSLVARTFARLQERVCDGNRDEGGKGNDEVGKELCLHSREYLLYHEFQGHVPLHRMCSLSRTFWLSVQKGRGVVKKETQRTRGVEVLSLVAAHVSRWRGR